MEQRQNRTGHQRDDDIRPAAGGLSDPKNQLLTVFGVGGWAAGRTNAQAVVASLVKSLNKISRAGR